MPSIPILQSHPVATLKKELSKTNIKGYSKLKKGALIELMMRAENRPRFHHIKMAGKKEKPAKPVPIMIKRRLKKLKKPIKPERATRKPAVKKEAQQAKTIAPKKRVASIPTVKKSAPQKTAGQKLTGLTKEEMNKLSPLALFGKLPVGLAVKKVLNPKATGVQVGKELLTFKQAEEKTNFDFNDEMIVEYESELTDNIMYDGDYEEVGFSSAKTKRYKKLLYSDNLSSKQRLQLDDLNDEFMEGLNALTYKRITRAQNAFKKKNTGKKSLKEWEKLWKKFDEEIDLDDYM